MATKWIKVPVTLHVPTARFIPFKWDEMGGQLAGFYDVDEVPPYTPTELEADEADKILARFADDPRAGEASAAEIAAIVAARTPPAKSKPLPAAPAEPAAQA